MCAYLSVACQLWRRQACPLTHALFCLTHMLPLSLCFFFSHCSFSPLTLSLSAFSPLFRLLAGLSVFVPYGELMSCSAVTLCGLPLIYIATTSTLSSQHGCKLVTLVYPAVKTPLQETYSCQCKVCLILSGFIPRRSRIDFIHLPKAIMVCQCSTCIAGACCTLLGRLLLLHVDQPTLQCPVDSRDLENYWLCTSRTVAV